MESTFPHGSHLTQQLRYHRSRYTCNLWISHPLNFAMVVIIDRSSLGVYATILVETLVTVGITPLELRYTFLDRSYTAVTPLSQWKRL